jgi:hypothetical protein
MGSPAKGFRVRGIALTVISLSIPAAALPTTASAG